jgi:endoglucanase
MRKLILGIVIGLCAGLGIPAQEVSKFIVVDQFGYLPDSRKVAVIRDPRVGFDADESFSPGEWYCLVNAVNGEKVYRAPITSWKNGTVDASSGDRAWHFDFTGVTASGRYYVLDEEQQLRSFEFVIAPDVFNEVLRQAMRSFYYQRAGFPKEPAYAGEAWADGASHLGPLQDPSCRSFFGKDDPLTERDVTGGWYDAGDYNKYTNWTASYVVELMKAYLERPEAWADDYNIPESGNGVPDILDEARWGIDHLLRLQQPGGAVLSIVGEDHASPPSAATGPSYYGPPNTSAALSCAAAFAIASRVYRSAGEPVYADTLLSRAWKAWDWSVLYPDSLFNNNDPAFSSQGLGAGRQEMDGYGRAMARLQAACYLFDVTGDTRFRDHFDAHYRESKLYLYNGYAYPFEAGTQEVLLHYTTLAGATPSVRDDIRSTYRKAIVNGTENLPAYTGEKDPYLAHTKDYTWGSNGVKSSHGSMNYNLITYGLEDGVAPVAREAAEAFIHNLHGVNPLDMVYLSNMYAYGAENSVNEFYHSWFTNGSALWDRVGSSTYGPAPGYLTGGPNPSYDWDGCCPSGCGSASNNQGCLSESISPPKGQPAQKSYKDFNTSWPLNSWSVTENSCGYQVRYIRLLSKFVTADMDCNGEVNGGAFIDSCGVCAGGNTGIEPSLDPSTCLGTPDSTAGDTMYIQGRHLYTAAGEKVVLRGVNEMFVWSDDPTGERFIPEIAQTGANGVRLVWTEENGKKEQLVELIERCIDHQMIAIPECHSATGEWDKLDICIQFWKDPVLREGIMRNRRWTLLNIGNEVGDENVTSVQFSAGYCRAIDSLRNWGYTVPIVIDASTWGQNVDIILETWKEILQHDPLHSILFSVHSYWSDTENYQRVANAAINEGLPVIIGEGPSPTAYPDCAILDYAEGLETAGRNEVGWLSWSWGGMPNGHCVPNFDHTLDGVFGAWRTPYAEEMMVGHPYSLMRTAERPVSFYPANDVQVSGIYMGSSLTQLYVGDTARTEVLVAPANAAVRDYLILLSGDTAAIGLDRESGLLVGLSGGKVVLEAVSTENSDIRYSREIEVLEIPVTSVTISPAEVVMEVGDTVEIQVDVLPENATVREFSLHVQDTSSVVALDTLLNRVIALRTGSAEVVAEWIRGGIKDTLVITVTEPVFAAEPRVLPGVTLYPNPNHREQLYMSCNQEVPVQMKILDLTGKIVLASNYSGNTVVDTKSFSPGTYLVIHSGRDYIFRHKLIIQ